MTPLGEHLDFGTLDHPPVRDDPDRVKRLDRYFLPVAFGLTPAFMILLTWVDDPGRGSRALKLYQPAVLAVEIATIVAVILGGARLRLSHLNWLLIAGWLAIAWITASQAPEAGRSLLWTAIWTVHLGFTFAAARVIEPKAAAVGLMAGFIIFALLLAVRAQWPVADWANNPPGLDQIRRFAYYASLIAGLSIGAMAGRHRILAFVAASAAFAMIFWDGARAALLATIVGSLAAALLLPTFRTKAVALLGPAAACAGLLISLLLPRAYAATGPERLFSTLDDSGRLRVWERTWHAILERPMFGWGEGQADLFTGFAQPHNLLLQTLLAWGAIGTALVACLGVAAASSAVKNTRSDTNLLAPATAVMTGLAYSMVDGTLFHVLPVGISALCVGLMLRARSEPAAADFEYRKGGSTEMSAASTGPSAC
jgi:O-antigen ligase